MSDLWKLIISGILGLIGVVGAFYIAIWWGIVEPILTIGKMIDSGDISFFIIGKEVIKFFLKEIVAIVWVYFFIILGCIPLFKLRD